MKNNKETVPANESGYTEVINREDITYVDLTLDRAFKKVYGTRGNEDILLMLLNAILPEKHICKVSLREQDQIPDHKEERKSIFDVNCETENGEQFIIEMQKTEQKDFGKRLFYYSTFEPRTQILTGGSSYDFKPLYVIGILDFVMKVNTMNDRVINIYNIINRDDHSMLLFDDFTYVTVELPKLKTDRSLLAENEKILYLIHNSGKMKSRPIEFQSPKFDKLFELITFAGMNREDQMEYLAELDKRLIRNSELQAAMENGEALGFVNGERSKARQTASIMKSKGLDFKLIVECTGLSIEDIEKL